MVSKKKSLNPADAHRKAQRQRELKKNKVERKKVREAIIVRKDTRGLENDVRQLEQKEKRGELDKAGRAELQDLRDELARIKAAKEEYVTAHPEHRKYVYPYSEQSGSGSGSKNDGDAGANQGPLGKDGVPRNPERSVYYHPVFNPFGVPPPGMPYLEKPPEQADAPDQEMAGEDEDEEDSDDEDDEEEDDDIALPSEPPPPKPADGEKGDGDAHAEDEDDDDDDDDDEIAMPEGPPPPKPPTAPRAMTGGAPPPPPPGYGPHAFMGRPQPMMNGPPPGFGPPPGVRPFPPPGFNNGFPPAPPPNFFPPNMGPGPGPGPRPMGWQGPPPPPPPGFDSSYHPPHRGGFGPHGQRGGRGGGRNAPREVHDPLSDEPHQTFQGYRLRPRPGSGPFPQNANGSQDNGWPSQPGGPPPEALGSSSTNCSAASAPPLPPGPAPSATISAAPQLRDLKKEATAFVPTAIRKKRAQEKARSAMGIPGRINAAPAGPEDECGYDAQMGLGPSTAPTEGVESSYAGTALLKPDLLSTLRGHFGGNTAPDGSNEGGGGRAAEENAAENGNGNGTKSAAKGKKGDDYEAYLRAVGDLI